MTQCDMYDLPESQCSHCHPPVREPVASSPHDIASRFQARYDGMAACGHAVYEGDRVAFNHDRQLLCEECAK